MKKIFARYLFGIMAVLLLMVFAGCSASIKGTGGTSIGKPEEGQYDFTAAWVKERSCFKVADESWRLGTLGGLSVKITSGDTAGIGGWYTKELTENWVMNIQISLKGVKDEEVTAAVCLGPDKDTSVLKLVIQRNADKKICVSLKKGDTDLVSSGFTACKDTEFNCILDNNGDDGKLRLYIDGNDKMKYFVMTDSIDPSVLQALKTFAFSADKSGVGFSRIGVDFMLYRPGTLRKYAEKGMEDLMANFWEGTPQDGRFIKNTESMVWEYGMAMLALETMYNATGNELYKDYVAAEWAYMKTRFTDERISRPGTDPNVACDDAAWTAMTLMTIYRVTGDQHALKLAGDTVRRSYDYWKDGSVSNGLWYRLDKGKPMENCKSVYAAGLMLSALEYHEATKGTDLVDPELYADTLELYKWTEEHLRRDGTKTYGDMVVTAEDNLYFCDFIENGSLTRPYGPAGGSSSGGIGEAGSCSALFGNMGMSAINAQLYRMTEKKEYLDKALATANSMTTSVYNNVGVLLNDRDAWTNAAFVRYWVRDVLTLTGIDSKNIDLIKNTGLSIAAKCRTEEGYYRAEWSGGSKWSLTSATKPDQIMTTATSVHMIAAGALAEKLELIK